MKERQQDASNQHGGNIYGADGQPLPWLDFSANINPLGLSPQVRQAMIHSLDEVTAYPDPQGRRLRQVIGAFYHLPLENLLLGNGAAELFYCFFYAVHPKRVHLLAPCFSEYERAARAAGAQIIVKELSEDKNFQIDLAQATADLRPKDVLVLCNPNNPTGTLLSRANLLTCIQEAQKQGAWVLADESFLDFCPDANERTVKDLATRYENLCVIQSMTKFYAIPGLRLGFAVLPVPLRAHMESMKDVWSVNVLAQNAGVAALADDKYQQATRDFMATEKTFVSQKLQQFEGIKVYPPAVNFVLFRLPVAVRNHTQAIVQQFRAHGILVRDCANYQGLGAGYLRMAVRTRAENLRFFTAMKEIFEGSF